ncbi:glycosyltransferase family 1 protein [Mycobacterium sp. Aquia_216]|uniref:glycosyltransferase family 4 protein n=1 Tax=Mycobacterium sp. Aquia_216 TaxID=2991729 RepID=UPI00227C3BE9|nr:glycosyltransferase family 1 protein [Mycobacterium sp. Aquia_216]WAJ47152.1 glycosyltransferase family 1 protein [Mycobacterium sp. Aquia_216]
MRLVVDCRYVTPERHNGISRYTTGLVHALAGLHPLTMLISDERQLAHLPDMPWARLSAPTSIREPLVARQVNRLEPDVVFSPMQTMGTWGRRYALVLTLHDLIYYQHRTPPPEFAAPIRLLWRLYHLAWWPQRLLLDRADAVVTVSDTSAGLIAAHRLTRRPVAVVPNAADPVPDPMRLPRTRSLVYMGSFMPYKNVETLVRAAALLPGYQLHLMSRVSAAERDRLTALGSGGPRLVFHDGADDATYREVLLGATALVTASRAEGFGLPLVEAMALGTPLVVSDIPVFREVGADAATYVDADDVAGFVRAVRALDDDATFAVASAKARKRAAHYSWERSAQVLLTLLRRTVQVRRHRG